MFAFVSTKRFVSALLLAAATQSLFAARVLADESQYFEEQAFVSLDSSKIHARGYGAYSDLATANRERAFAVELAAFESRCIDKASAAGWSHTVRIFRQPFTTLDRANRRWYSNDEGTMHCYGITH